MRIAPYQGEPELTDALVDLFRASGCDCFCRYWHFEGDKNDWQARVGLAPDDNLAELRSAAEARSPEARGLLAMEGEAAVGWAKLVPLAAAPKLAEHRYYKSLLSPPRPGEWALGCLLVRPDRRRVGVATALAKASFDAVRAWGGTSLVGFPRAHEGKLADEEHWRGPLSTFERAGFERAAGDPAFPLMRSS